MLKTLFVYYLYEYPTMHYFGIPRHTQSLIACDFDQVILVQNDIVGMLVICFIVHFLSHTGFTTTRTWSDRLLLYHSPISRVEFVCSLLDSSDVDSALLPVLYSVADTYSLDGLCKQKRRRRISLMKVKVWKVWCKLPVHTCISCLKIQLRYYDAYTAYGNTAKILFFTLFNE